MDDQSQTKTCPLCAEIIKAAAKVCPFCRAAQSQFSLLREQLSIVVPPLLFLTLLGFVCYLVFPEHLGSSGRNFTRHREDLRVVRTSLERLMKKTDFSLAGYVTNTGTYPWRVRELELRLLDPKGNLVYRLFER